ncbi:MAG: hypothetical protein LBS77_05550 [Desulfovibrio sp.]|nr:hypothetical protein [Desulfovibrio sp.]
MVSPVLTAPDMPLLPYLEYFLDESGEMEGTEVTSVENIQAFKPVDLKNLPHKAGSIWLRFILAPLPENTSPSTILLDLGESVPGVPTLKRKISRLPAAGREAKTCLIRLDGVPGPWFAPMLRTPENATDNWERFARSAGVLSLAVVMLLCLLRCLTEKGQWRLWTAGYAGAALLQAFLGLPATGHGRIEIGNAVAALAPGMALMLFSHVGRHLTGVKSRSMNIQFLFLSLPGAALALLPLLSNLAWTTRYFNLWPLGTLIFAPSALGAAMMGIPCARRFLLGCLLPPLFIAMGFLLANDYISSSLLSSAPLWGTALSVMIIATTAVPTDAPLKKFAAAGKDNTEDTPSTLVYNLEKPFCDPNLRLIPPRSDEYLADAGKNQPSTQTTSSTPPQNLSEDILRLPLERLMREATTLEHCSLPLAVRQYVENMLNAGREIADVISNQHKGLSGTSNKVHTVFNLQHLMCNVYDSVAPMAKTTGIDLAWYMPPHLGHIYKGEVEAIDQGLRMLLKNAVRATQHGAVQFSVRRVPESTDAGHLLFTVKDTGSGMPPQHCSILALTHVWELAVDHNGFLCLECSPQGTIIAFTLHLRCCEDEDRNNELSLPHIIIIAESAVDRQLLSHMLKSLPCRSSETRYLNKALLLHKKNPALLIVFHGHFADVTAPLLRQFADEAILTGLPFCKFLGITRDNSRWDAMVNEGFTHALAEPLDSEIFCTTVHDILNEYSPAGATVNRDDNASVPEPDARTDFGEKPQNPAEHTDDANANATSKPESIRPPQGCPVIPDLFAADAVPGMDGQIEIPALNALPDLLSFGVGGELFGGLSQTEPLPQLDIPHLENNNATRKKIDGFLPYIFAAAESSPPNTTSVTLPDQRTRNMPPVSAASNDAGGESMTVFEPVSAPTGSATNAEELSVEPAAQEQSQVPSARLNHSPQNSLQTPSQAQSISKTVDATIFAADNALGKNDVSGEWVGEPMPVPSQNASAQRFVEQLDRAVEDAQNAFAQRRAAAVSEAARRIAAESDNFGLRVLARMARCVERAARANDMNSLKDLLSELTAAVERNRIVLHHIRQQQ